MYERNPNLVRDVCFDPSSSIMPIRAAHSEHIYVIEISIFFPIYEDDLIPVHVI